MSETNEPISQTDVKIEQAVTCETNVSCSTDKTTQIVTELSVPSDPSVPSVSTEGTGLVIETEEKELDLKEMELDSMCLESELEDYEENTTTSESDHEKTVVEEDEYGREYVILNGVTYKREDDNWHIPYVVQVSFTMIMFINIINLVATTCSIGCRSY